MKIRSGVYETFAADMSAAAILNLRSETWYHLNGSAARVWLRLRNGLSLGLACREVAEEYGIEPTLLERDLRPVLDELVDAGVLGREESP